MPRDVTIPQQTIVEDFMSIDETPGSRVKVFVGVLRADGQSFDVEKYPPKAYIIDGDNFAELNGPPTSWAPDKPYGTYRNQDLWYFVDKLRNPHA